MLRKSKRSLALLLTFMMLATLFAGVPMASASSTYSISSSNALVKNTVYADAAASTFNRITVEIPEGQLLAATTFRLAAPSDYGFNVVGISTPDLDLTAPGVQNQILTPVALDLAPVGTPLTVATYLGAANIYKEWNITVNPDALSTAYKGRLYIDINAFYVPSGANDGDVKLTIDAPPGSALSSGQVNVGYVGSGLVTLQMDDVNTVTSAGGTINTLRIKEDRAGALSAGANSVKLKLPNGYTWRNPALIAGALVWGTAGTVPAAGAFTLADSDRTLTINIPAVSTDATYFTVTGLGIDVDDSVAKFGDIVATVSGNSSITTNELTIGAFEDFSINVSAFGEPKTVTTGKAADQEMGKIVIEEGVANSLLTGRTVTLQLVGAKWKTNAAGTALADVPTVDGSNSKNNKLTTAAVSAAGAGIWDPVGSSGDTIRTTVGASVGKAKIVLEKGEIVVSPTASEDIKLIVGGTAGATGEILVAKVVKPATLSIDGQVMEVNVGSQGTEIAPLIITENKAEAISATAGANTLRIQFPYGVRPNIPKVEVIEGDLLLDVAQIGATASADGRWGINIGIRSTSSVASKIKLSGIKLTVDRTVPEGAITADLRGNAIVQTMGAQYFPNVAAVGSVAVAQVLTPAAEGSAKGATFTIGNTTYTVNGIEKTMDVAPYIKDDRTYMPIRYVAMALGVAEQNIMWDDSAKTATLIKGDKVVQVKIGSKVMLINGININMDVAPEITNDRTMLPLRWIGQAFGANFTWDDETKTATMNM